MDYIDFLNAFNEIRSKNNYVWIILEDSRKYSVFSFVKINDKEIVLTTDFYENKRISVDDILTIAGRNEISYPNFVR